VNFVGLPALIAAIVGPIQATLGWVISGALWPGFDHVTKTISDLAADDSPVKWIQSSFFLLGGTLSLIAAVYAPVLAMAGRVTIFVAGLTTYGLTFFAVPTQETSSFWHRMFAIATFDRSYPWLVRPAGAILATVVFTVSSLVFLSVWRDPAQPMVGLWERVIAVSQVLYLSVVIISAWRHQRRPARR
jgi:hypothetical membrane protein